MEMRLKYKLKALFCKIKYEMLFFIRKITGHYIRNDECYLHCKKELELVLNTMQMSDDKKDYTTQKRFNKALLKLVYEYVKAEKNLCSMSYLLSCIPYMICYGAPLTPITGSNHEWSEFSRETDNNGMTEIKYENKRYSALEKIVTIDKFGEKKSETYMDYYNPTKDICFPYMPEFVSN